LIEAITFRTGMIVTFVFIKTRAHNPAHIPIFQAIRRYAITIATDNGARQTSRPVALGINLKKAQLTAYRLKGQLDLDATQYFFGGQASGDNDLICA